MNPIRINDTTYEVTLPAGDRVEIGDKDSADFRPCARLNRWGTECSLVLGIPTSERTLPAVQNGKILWQGRDYGAEFLAATDGFKFNIILSQKPGTNLFPLDFGSDNLKFCYQPPLTEEFKEGWSEEFKRDIFVTETQVTDKDGNILVERPENVVGSYAVYHASRGNMHPSQAEAEKYKTGKAFHWYRPLIYDSAGHQTWGILNVDPGAGIRTVAIPQGFLDKAVYPVTIDDTFGYTTQGGSSTYGTNKRIGCRFTSSGSGTGASISWANNYSFSTGHVKCCLYESDLDKVTNGETEEKTSGGADVWITHNFISSPTIAAADYWLYWWSDTFYPEEKYDSVTGWPYTDVNIAYGAWPDPISHNELTGRKYSIYCTYTPGGGATEKQLLDAGAGADWLLARDMALPEAGAGVDAFVSLQTPAAKTASDSGSGADGLVSLQVPQTKTSSDNGYGAEAMPICSALLSGSEGGYGIEAFFARLLAAAEAGYGAEASIIGGGGLLKDLFASELGEGADGLTAKIEIPNKGGGMKLWT